MRLVNIVIILLFGSIVAFADTITLKSNYQINGKTKFANGNFIVEATYRNQTKTLFFPKSDVKKVEFNDNENNQGGAPIWFERYKSRSDSYKDTEEVIIVSKAAKEINAANSKKQIKHEDKNKTQVKIIMNNIKREERSAILLEITDDEIIYFDQNKNKKTDNRNNVHTIILGR